MRRRQRSFTLACLVHLSLSSLATHCLRDTSTRFSSTPVVTWPEIRPSGAGPPCPASTVKAGAPSLAGAPSRSEEHTSELQSLMRISYAVFCLKKKKNKTHKHI